MVLQESLNYLCGMEQHSCSLKGEEHSSAPAPSTKSSRAGLLIVCKAEPSSYQLTWWDVSETACRNPLHLNESSQQN